jgi:hypothetical protein
VFVPLNTAVPLSTFVKSNAPLTTPLNVKVLLLPMALALNKVIALLSVAGFVADKAPLLLVPVPLSLMVLVFESVPLKFISNVAPAVTLVSVVLPSPVIVLIRNVPCETVVVPLYVLFPVKTTVPAPVFVKLNAPSTTPANVSVPVPPMLLLLPNVMVLFNADVFEPVNAPLPPTPVPLIVIVFVFANTPMIFMSNVAPDVTLVPLVLPRAALEAMLKVPLLTVVLPL